MGKRQAEKYLISDATKRNWDKLHANDKGKLTRRANKSQSQKLLVPDGYVTAGSLRRFVETLMENDYPLPDLIFTLCALKIEQNKASQANQDRFLNEYGHYQRLEIEVPRQIAKNRQDDWIGYIYQSLVAEGQRILNGLYYTKPAIVDTMVEGIGLNEKQQLLDPCCGSGIILLHIEEAQLEQLFGIDNDPIAVMIAKANLMSKYNTSETYPQIYLLDFLKHGMSGLSGKQFDYIITNPPWGSDKQGSGEEKSTCFFQHAMPHLKEKGEMVFLLPTSLLKIKRHEAFREFVKNETCVEQMILHQERFNGVFTDFIILKTSQKAEGKTHKMEFALPQLDEEEEAILDIMDQKRNDDLSHSQWALGVITGNNAKWVKERKGKDMEKIYIGKDIEKYHLRKASHYIRFDRSKFQQCAKDELYRAKEKLVYKFIANHLCFAYDDTQSLFLNSANILIPDIEGMSVKTVMAFLNSELFSFYYTRRFGDIKILKGNLCCLPFPEITPEQDRELSSMVDAVLEGNQKVIQDIDDYILKLYDIKL